MKNTVAALMPLLLVPAMVSGQQDRLSRLDAQAAANVHTVIAEAASKGLPTEPLIQKALEGSIKGASPANIVSAVRSLSQRIEIARHALGGAAREPELVAAASALYVGVSSSALVRLRELRGDQSLTMHLTALAFFVQQGVSRDASVDLVESLVNARITEKQILMLQEAVGRDIRAGARPGAASSARVEALVRSQRELP